MTENPVIRQLPKETSDKIAAGEVVERPLSIVKELTENAIDAGADSITIEIRKGGKEYIRVTDNGCGIEKEQLELAFRRYATSKIYQDKDLYSIRTLGFRGEALASIAAVSRTEMLSKTRSARAGARISLIAGEKEEICDYACENGTTIVVRDLFFNIPARRKFLRADNSEASLITDYISKMALAYAAVRFRLINNGNILFATAGKGDIRSAIATVYGPAAAKNLIEIKSDPENTSFDLSGYISSPSDSLSTRRRQIFFVNGRWVRSKLIEQAVDDTFRDKLFDGRFPGAYLFLQISPQLLDVNIHPNKTDIRFMEEEQVKDYIYRKLRKALLVKEAAPQMSERFSSAVSQPGQKSIFTIPENRIPLSECRPEKAAAAEYAEENEQKYKTFFGSLRAEKNDQLKISAVTHSVSDETGCSVAENFGKPMQQERPFHFSDLRFIGQIFAAYLVAEDEKNVYFIDQHAAHERILFEKLIRDYNADTASSQLLLIPFLIETGAAVKLAAQERLDMLRRIGYAIEEFGPAEFVVKEIPSSLRMEEAEPFLHSVLEAEMLNQSDLQQKRDYLISRACKSAIKANDHMNREEVMLLFRQLDQCENPFSCPHGRPTFVRLSDYDMERLFKRK